MGTSPNFLVMQSLLTAAAATSRNGVFDSSMGTFISGTIEMTSIANPPAEADPLPQPVADGLVSGMDGVTPADTARLREWMGERGLRASSWINASQYLVEMNRESRLFEGAHKRYFGPGREVAFYEGGKGFFWVGCNDPMAQVFVTHGEDTRQVHHGRPVRIRPGDVVTFGCLSMQLVVDHRGTNFFRAETPPVLRDDEPTRIIRLP